MKKTTSNRLLVSWKKDSWASLLDPIGPLQRLGMLGSLRYLNYFGYYDGRFWGNATVLTVFCIALIEFLFLFVYYKFRVRIQGENLGRRKWIARLPLSFFMATRWENGHGHPYSFSTLYPFNLGKWVPILFLFFVFFLFFINPICL